MKSIRLHPKLKSFYEKNSESDILTFNFLSSDKIPLSDDKTEINTLMAYQRLLRLHEDVAIADELMADNLDSSLKITNVGKTVFINTYGPRFGEDGKSIAKKVYETATQCKSMVMHLVASAKNVAASPNFKTTLFNPITDDVSKTFQDLASYQDFFGSLDYCECDDCKSIFGPAAYLVDLLRIIDQGITKPNQDIPEGLTLFDRRPDLQKIELTCENTNTLIPYLQIVNNLLENTLENALKQDDVYLTLANSYYPFNLPFNLPLQQVEAVMENKHLSLAEVALALQDKNDLSITGKILKLSVETLNNLKPPVPAELAAVVSANYGLTVSDGNLNGLNEVKTFLKQSSLSLADLNTLLTESLSAKEFFDVSGNYTPSVFGPVLVLEEQGNTVSGTFTDGKIEGTMDGRVMKGQWSDSTGKGDIEFTFSADGTSFTGKWSKGLGKPWETTAWNGTLNGTSSQGVIPHSLFINATLADKQYLSIVDDRIVLQNLSTLDRQNRFIRLSALMGWSYTYTNWLLKTLTGNGDITDTTLNTIARIKQVISKYGLDPEVLSSMWFDIRTIGMGNGTVSEAPFDKLFNTPIIRQQTGMFYRPVIAASATSFVNPLYTSTPALFVVDQPLYDKSNPDEPTKLLVSQGQVIIRGIPASQDNILTVAQAIFGKVATIELTVPNLSSIYRHIMLAQQMNITIDSYLLLLKLLGYSTGILDIAAVSNILDTMKSIQSSGFTIYDIDYLINQNTVAPVSPYVNNGYRLSMVDDFLKTIRIVLQGGICNADSFAYSGLSADASGQVYESLVVLGFINASGLIVKDADALTPAVWSNIYIGTLLQQDDFICDILTKEDSVQIFAGLLAQYIISTSGHIIKNITAIDWSKILIGDNKVPLTADQQKAVLAKLNFLQYNTSTDQQQFISSQLTSLQSHLASVFSNQIGAFFGVEVSVAALAIDAVRDGNSDYLQSFLIPVDIISKEFLLNISKVLMLQRIPGLTAVQFSGICLSPAAYNLSGENTYSLGSVLLIAGLKSVVQSLGDRDNKMIQYFRDVWSSEPPSADALQNELCTLTGWNKAQYISVTKRILNNPDGCKTLGDLVAVKKVFDLAYTLGIDTYLLQDVNDATSRPATIANWPAYNTVATKLLLTVQDVYKTINAKIEGQKRDAMLFFSIAVLGKTWEDIDNPRSLYEFLLIDPETSGAYETSLIEEAMNATQLYLQRCRLNLEKNIRISTDDIPDVWWEWMMNYRVWEANRRIFVYPENYINPSLRKSKTSLFSDLQNTLMQGEVTMGLVEDAYVKYLDNFSSFAKLRYVDAYQTIVHDKERGAIDTLFLFSRTQEQPYHFYYITREIVGDCSGDDQYLWSEWKSINIKIDAEHITPVYAFNKLFVFWVELSRNKESRNLTASVNGGTSITPHDNIITKASIKYSYYNFNEKWVQPQTLVADKVVNVFSPDTDIYGSFRREFTDLSAPCWRKVSVINTTTENYVGDIKSPDEKLVVYFGPLANYDTLDKLPAIPDLVNDSTAVYAFKDMLKHAYFNLDQMRYFNRQGYIPLCSHYVIDEVLNNQIILNQNEYLVLPANTLSSYMLPTFTPDLNNNILAIHTNYSTIIANNNNSQNTQYTGLLNGPLSVDNYSFVVSPYIDSTQSKLIKSQIDANMPGVIVNNVITAVALTLTVSDISSLLGISWEMATLVQTRFYELYYGACILFSDLAFNAEVVAVKNQPNTFILDNNDEAFLLTAVNNIIDTTVPVLNTSSFVSKDITQADSEKYFGILSKAPNNCINTDGTVNSLVLKKFNAAAIATLLACSTEIATEVLNVLTVGGTTVDQNITTHDFDKIDSRLRITAVLTPDCFVSGTTTAAVSEKYFSILSTSPNNYIYEDGAVDQQKMINVDPNVIATLLGLPSGGSEVLRIINLLKAAAGIMTNDSFITYAVDPKTGKPYIPADMSATYFTILSTYPNDYIDHRGLVNMNMLDSTSSYSIAVLLGFDKDPDNFVVEKVLNVLMSYTPVALSYVYDDLLPIKDANKQVYVQENIYSLQFNIQRISTGAINTIGHAMTFGGIDAALATDIQQPPVTIKKPFSSLAPSTRQLAAPLKGRVINPPAIITNQQVDFEGPYGLYYWELFFHTPFLVAYMLNTNQQFSDAESWMQYIFNPTAQNKYLTLDVFVTQRPQDMDESLMKNLYPVLTTDPNQYIDSEGRVTSLILNATPFVFTRLLAIPIDQATEILNLLKNYYVSKPEMRAWGFEPFRNYTLQTLLQNLTSCAQIAVYNDDPFDPDGIARLRIGAYEKAIMMKYIDNLLDWGDFEFTQYSRESITRARMYYCYANDLLGPRPVSVGACEDSFPVTFQDIAAKYGEGNIPQFLIDMEHLAGQGAIHTVAGNTAKPYNDLGYYFGIPDNSVLTAYWDRIEDRLYKIRHCLNIDGVAQPLPLFQPPLNPMDLVRAAAQGGNILNVASQQQQNISYYRFSYLMDRARAYTELVSEFGNSLLSALEKSDAEALAVLNLNQARTVLNMTLVIKNKQLEGLQYQLAGMQESLESAQKRNTFYTGLINAGYNTSENSGLAYMQSSIEVMEVMAGIQGVSIAGYLAPNIFGLADGGMDFGDAINMGAQMLQTVSQIMSQKGSSAETIAQFQRRAEEWGLQQQMAQFEINQIQNQILSLQANITSSQQEIDIQKTNIDQNEALINFYQSKFTNQELYQWMTGRLSAVYFQAYKLALDTALTAQMSYQYELDRDDQYIMFGYWDALHKGLMAADGLKLSLAQLENAYIENNKRRMEIEKVVSLKSLNPEAFYAFLSGPDQGNLAFSLTEELFDRDFPAHYCRRIKSISVSIPAVVGPYQNIHATLTQNTNLVVLKPEKEVVNYVIYQTAAQKSGNVPELKDPAALRQDWASSQRIVLSKGSDDTGLFVLNYDDPRYLPFEATGAVSGWTLSMPPATNPVDFNSIADVILNVRYTAIDGGSAFGRDVTTLYTGTDKQYQNIRINTFDLNQAFAGSWYQLFQSKPDVNKQQTLTFPVSDNVVLPNLKNVILNQVIIDIRTAEGAEISNNQKGLSLKVGTVTVPVNITGNRGTVSDSDISKISSWKGQDWSLIFTPDQIPEVCSNNKLDEKKLLDMILFIAYTSNM